MIRHLVNVARAAIHEARKRQERSTRWPHVEHAYLAQHGSCAACGDQKRLQVHHRQPFHLYPALELEPTNLIALCMGPKECHLAIGHGGNFKRWNPDVQLHAARALADPELFDHYAALARLSAERAVS